MSIEQHVERLQQHLAQFGLYPVPAGNDREGSEVFKICFLNKYEMQRWQELRENESQQPASADRNKKSIQQ